MQAQQPGASRADRAAPNDDCRRARAAPQCGPWLRAFAGIALLAFGLAPGSGTADVSAELEVRIAPPPGSPGGGPRMPAPGVRSFPQHELSALFLRAGEEREATRLRRARRGISAIEAPVLDAGSLAKLQTRLHEVLPPGRYRFDLRCPLVLQPPPPGEEERLFAILRIGCLPPELRQAMPLRLYDDRNLTARAALFSALEPREFRGELILRRAGLEADAQGLVLDWSWRSKELAYANPFLEYLRRGRPEAAEDELLSRESVRRGVPGLLALLARLADNDMYLELRSPHRDFSAVFPPGSWISFRGDCPLRLNRALRREAGSGLFRLGIEIGCISGSPLAQSEILLTPEVRAEKFYYKLFHEEQVRAVLKFREIRYAGRQFRLVWDTIKDIEQHRDFRLD